MTKAAFEKIAGGLAEASEIAKRDALIASQAKRIAELEAKLSCIPAIIYRVPSYVVGGFDRDDNGVVLPGSPYDRGRYDARKAVEEAISALLNRGEG